MTVIFRVFWYGLRLFSMFYTMILNQQFVYLTINICVKFGPSKSRPKTWIQILLPIKDHTSRIDVRIKLIKIPSLRGIKDITANFKTNNFLTIISRNSFIFIYKTTKFYCRFDVRVPIVSVQFC